MAVYNSYNPGPPIEVPIWAFAYDIDNETGYVHLRCLPTKGEVRKSGYCTKDFIPYKKNGTDLAISKSVRVSARKYADTYDEAKAAYNKLVQDRIDRLNKMAIDAENDKLI